jgi:hypothetical protein
MNKKNSVDSFDDVPVDLTRRGAHRAPVKTRRGFVVFAWGALATGLLVTAGIGGLVVVSETVSLKDFSTLFSGAVATPTPTPVPTAEPTVDPALQVSVLNATDSPGLATSVSENLTAAGWVVGSRTNASDTVENTVVYYGNPGLEGAARGVLATLGVGTIELTDAYIESSSQITVVLGSDFVTPVIASDEPAAS